MEYDTFLDALAARITTIPGVQAVARAGSGELQLTLAGDATARINPRNAWRAVQAGETLDHVLAVQADVIATTIARQGQIGTWQDAAPRIVTRLERADLARQHERVARPWIVPELWEIVVEDAPTHMRGVLTVDAAAWGQEPTGLFDRGLANLQRIAEGGERPRQASPRLWMLATGDGYAASRLLLPRWLLDTLPARRGPCGWLCAAPARDVLVLTPLVTFDNPAQILAFAAAVRGLGRMAHPFPIAPLLLADGEIRPLSGLMEAA